MITRIKWEFFKIYRKIFHFFLKTENSQINQQVLVNQYLLMKKILPLQHMPLLNQVGFSVYSQFEEDWILLYIFSIIGTQNKRLIEICAGDGIECMGANLVINHWWDALFFDGSSSLVSRGNRFYKKHNSTFLHPPIFKKAWITKENVNSLIKECGFYWEIDLLSLDMDGNDYHVMESINVVSPRVIICETHNVIPSNLAITIPYNPSFNRNKSEKSDFMGASLMAMKKLLDKKWYRLVWGHKYGFNAIFIRKDVGVDFFPEVDVESIHNNLYTKARQDRSWNKVKNCPWLEV